MTDETKPEEATTAVAEEQPKPTEEQTPDPAAQAQPEAGDQPAPAEQPETGEEAEDGEAKKKLDQKVLIREVGPCRKHITVTIQREDIDELFAEKYKDLVHESQVPGFRPGKAPKSIVVRKFRKDVEEQVRSQVLLASLEQLAEDFEVAPLSPPNINPDKLMIPEKGPFTYEFEVEVRPDFELPNYRGLNLTRPVRQFNDADVEKEEQRLLSRYGSLVPKPEGNAEMGEYIIVDMVSRLDGNEIGKASELTLRVDDTLTFKDGVARGFADKVKGASAGDERTVEVVLTDAAVEQIRGKTVQATLSVKDVKKLRLPELTEDFLNTYFGVRTPEQLREQVRLLLERRLEYQQRQSARDQVMGLFAASATWELPNDLLMRQARKAFNRKVMEMQDAGLSEEEISARSRMMQQDIIKNTSASLKEHFVLQKIAEVEKIEVDDDDINQEIENIAYTRNESARRVRAQLEREDLLETVAAQIIERQALDLILESAVYEDVPLAPEGTMAAVEQQAAEGQMRDPTQAPEPAKTEETASPAAEKTPDTQQTPETPAS